MNKYLIKEKFPLFWCAGCGNGTVLHALTRCMERLNLEQEQTVVVTGIGCWGKVDDYINTNAFHGTHGRALPFATGIKLANPELKVIVLMGDGDGVTIGGNHLIHAARRNVELTAIIVNNLNYGMTGGQYSGTTPMGTITSTSRYGHVEPPFDLCNLVMAAGAPFVARGTTYDIRMLENLIYRALQVNGFSFVEAISQCPTHFGKNNRIRAAKDMLIQIKENSVSKVAYNRLSDEEKIDKYVVGVLRDEDRIDFSTQYAAIIDRLTSSGDKTND